MAELVLLVALCGVLTYAWRGLGVLISGRVDARGEAFTWISCVAYAMIAGLVARMLTMPTGVLEDTSVLERAVASAIALGVYFRLTNRNLLAGVAAGGAALSLIRFAAG
ncbi:MAG TPA: AzlD domain-containing protein [Burkholderiales bacterium]|nr:AzlD domain-containing protein [Burkholderiales bacterium]